MILVTDKFKTQMKKEPEKAKEEPSSMFQRQRVDMLLGELMRKFPLPIIPNPNAPQTTAAETNTNTTTTTVGSTALVSTTNPSNVNGNPASNVNGDFRPAKIQRLT